MGLILKRKLSTQGNSNISIRIYVCTDMEENLNKSTFKKVKNKQRSNTFDTLRILNITWS